MAFEPKRKSYTFSDFAGDIPQIVSAAFALLVIGVLALLLCAAAFTIGHAVWPSGRFTVDKNVVELVRAFVWPLAFAIAMFFFVTSRTLQSGQDRSFKGSPSLRQAPTKSASQKKARSSSSAISSRRPPILRAKV